MNKKIYYLLLSLILCFSLMVIVHFVEAEGWLPGVEGEVNPGDPGTPGGGADIHVNVGEVGQPAEVESAHVDDDLHGYTGSGVSINPSPATGGSSSSSPPPGGGGGGGNGGGGSDGGSNGGTPPGNGNGTPPPPPPPPPPPCSVRAQASPNPIPEWGEEVKITASSSGAGTCKISVGGKTYPLGTTFDQKHSDPPRTYTVSCPGDSNHRSCSSSILVYPIPPCEINYFRIPEQTWIGYEATAEWSTNAVCTVGEISCKTRDGGQCDGKETLSRKLTVFGKPVTEVFKILNPGYYDYTLTACRLANEPRSCKTLKSEGDFLLGIELPSWWEIIPVLPGKLQGSLRGLFN